MDEDGQAYIATAVALGALLVAMFAAPALTHASLAAGTQADLIARAIFVDETDDVLRILEREVAEVTPQATVDCYEDQETRPDPNNASRNITVSIWDCESTTDCGGDDLVTEFEQTLDALRPLVQMAINGSASLQDGCVADCEDGERPEPTPMAATTAIDVTLILVASMSDASFAIEAFGGERDVDVECMEIP